MYKKFYYLLILFFVNCDNPQINENPGCTDEVACNFQDNADLDDGTCIYKQENFDCDGNCIVDIDCNGECGGDKIFDECGICGGNGIENFDCDGNCIVDIDCNGECGGIAKEDICGTCQGNIALITDCPCPSGNYDECGICEGPGSIYECGCETIEEGRCDCDGRREDCAGVCGGTNIVDNCGNCGNWIVANNCDSSCRDCSGVCGGDSIIDCNGECNGGAIIDCAGICGGSSITDINGNCFDCPNELEYELVWSDEFESASLDFNKWNIEQWPSEAFNEEEQVYTDETDNIFILEDNLHIRANREAYDFNNDNEIDGQYTSGRISTKYKGDWQYAKVEVKAKLPLGAGTWPAIWLLPTDYIYGQWPSSGEIDIMEHVGKDPGMIHSSVHNSINYKDLPQEQTGSIAINNIEDWHIYSMIWERDKIVFSVDDQLVKEYDNQHTGYDLWPFDQRFHIVINLAIGGTWGGEVNPAIFPVEFIIDYVRVYQKPCSNNNLE